MVHKIKPIKMFAFDFKDGQFQTIDLYPESKAVVIHPATIFEKREIRKFEKIRDGLL